MEVNKTKFERVIVIVEFRSQFSNASFKKKELVNKILRKKKQKKNLNHKMFYLASSFCKHHVGKILVNLKLH